MLLSRGKTFSEVFTTGYLPPRVIFLISFLIYTHLLSGHQIIFQRFKYFFAWSVSSRNQFLSSAKSKPRNSSAVSLCKAVSSELEAHFLHLLWLMNLPSERVLWLDLYLVSAAFPNENQYIYFSQTINLKKTLTVIRAPFLLKKGEKLHLFENRWQIGEKKKFYKLNEQTNQCLSKYSYLLNTKSNQIQQISAELF